MAWTWRFEKADGTEVPPAVEPEEFTTQGDAESWIGEVWKELLEGGADQAVLFEDETRIYGPMSLHAESDGDGGADAAGAGSTEGGGESVEGAAPAEASGATQAPDGI
jgi:hypothetical protein